MHLQPMLATPIAALAVGLVAVRIMRRTALAIGFVDHPDRRRKLHDGPIALGGGIAVWMATWCAWGGGLSFLPAEPVERLRLFLALAASSLLMLALGVVDDRRGLRAIHKLAGQILIATIPVAAGLRIDALSGFGCVVGFGDLGVLLTIGWIVLVVNAFNLIDGMDGFCGGVGFVTALALAVMAYRSGRTADALIGLALAGALAAFLRDNLPPARIYLGDAGSMSLGLMFAVLSIRACTDGAGGPVALLPLVALVALPLLDVASALARRGLAGQPLFLPDRGHIHHRLRLRLGSTPVAMMAAVGLAALGGVGAVLARASDSSDGLALLALVVPPVLLVGTDTFGGSELRLVLYRLRQLSARFLRGALPGDPAPPQECRLHGGRDWAEVWDDLMRSVDGWDVRRIDLAIDIPAANETYHGSWSRLSPAGSTPHWWVVHPIQVRGTRAGELRVSGGIAATSAGYLDRVEGLVQILEGHLAREGERRPAVAAEALAAPTLSRIAWRGTGR